MCHVWGDEIMSRWWGLAASLTSSCGRYKPKDAEYSSNTQRGKKQRRNPVQRWVVGRRGCYHIIVIIAIAVVARWNAAVSGSTLAKWAGAIGTQRSTAGRRGCSAAPACIGTGR